MGDWQLDDEGRGRNNLPIPHAGIYLAAIATTIITPETIKDLGLETISFGFTNIPTEIKKKRYK